METSESSCKKVMESCGILEALKSMDLATEIIYHFTVVCFGFWPLNGNEAGGDLTAFVMLIKLFLC